MLTKVLHAMCNVSFFSLMVLSFWHQVVNLLNIYLSLVETPGIFILLESIQYTIL